MTSPNALEHQFHKCMPLFIALGDEVRLSIIEVLSRALYDSHKIMDGRPVPYGLNVNEITRKTNLSRPAISHHLKILKDAELIDVKHAGTSNYYFLALEKSNEEMMALGDMVRRWLYRS